MKTTTTAHRPRRPIADRTFAFPAKNKNDDRGPRHVSSILDEIRRSPGGLLGEVARIVAKGSAR